MPEISVVISTLGNYGGLARVLAGYDRQDLAADRFELLVVVDRADPEPERVQAMLADRPHRARMLRGPRPGLSANRNAGVAAAGSELVLFTDNDTIPDPRLLAEHLDWHRRHPAEEVAVLGHVRWARELKVTPFMHWLDHGIQFDYPNISGRDAGWGRLYGANSSLKKTFVERVGGYDEDQLPYLYEDMDFAYRADKLDLRVLYNRDAVVEHLRPMDLAFWRQKAGRLARAERIFTAKHPEVPPHFQRMFAHALKWEPARGRGRSLIRWIPRTVPWLGDYLWTSAEVYYLQALAPGFFEAWEEAESSSPEPGQPEGSSPSGPK